MWGDCRPPAGESQKGLGWGGEYSSLLGTQHGGSRQDCTSTKQKATQVDEKATGVPRGSQRLVAAWRGAPWPPHTESCIHCACNTQITRAGIHSGAGSTERGGLGGQGGYQRFPSASAERTMCQAKQKWQTPLHGQPAFAYSCGVPKANDVLRRNRWARNRQQPMPTLVTEDTAGPHGSCHC